MQVRSLIAGQQKAAVGGVSAGALTLLAQYGVNGNMTVRELVTSVASWLVAHLFVYITTNK